MSPAEIRYDIERQSIAFQVFQYIKHLILSGELKGGEKIPEERVAKQFGVSRTPIREALKRLEEYGLIQMKPRSFAVVVEFDPEEAKEISLIRAQIESISVSILTEKGTEEDFDALEALANECDKVIAKADIAGTFEKDSQLHLEIAKRTGHRHLYNIYEKIDAKVQLLRLVIHLPIKELKIFVRQHSDLIKAMRLRDKRLAKSLINYHIMGQLKLYS